MKTRFQAVVWILTVCKSWSKYLYSGEKRFPCENFRHCGTRNFWRKILILPPPPTLSFNFFPYPKLMKYWKIPLRNFSALWDKKISKENLETFPAPLIHKHFRYRKTSATKHGRVPLRNFSALWDKKNRQIFVTKPSEAWKFSIPENSDTLKGCPTKFFDTVRQKKLTENGDTPPPPSPSSP